MRMKKNVLALAISGGMIMAPAAAMADGPEVYGMIDIGLEHYTDSDGAAGFEIFNGFNSVDGNSDARDFGLQNGMSSRLGVRGEEDLGWGGLSASYTIELAIDVLGETGGGFSDSVGTRLGWAALNGDWGTLKVGSQWMPLYEFGGWNTMRTDTHGYGTYFYTTSLIGANSNSTTRYGFRQGSAISYSYGSAWGHSDPFAFNVSLGVGEGEATTGEREINEDGEFEDNRDTIENENGITSVTVAAQYSFDQRISVNAVYYRDFNSFDRDSFDDPNDARTANQEPELYNVGARFSVTDALELAANYTLVDTDNDDGDKRDAISVASFMDFGNGLTGHLGFATGSDDRDETTFDGRDIDLNTYGYVKQALSDRTSVRLELENVQYDIDTGAQDDSSATVAMIGLQHSF